MQVFSLSTAPDDRALDLHGAYLTGAEGVPVRGEIAAAAGKVKCDTRSVDPTGLSMLWSVDGFGCVQLETTRLPVRKEPYSLVLELARHRLMRISMKREEWGLFDYSGIEEIASQIDGARELFVQALENGDAPETAETRARESLVQSMWASERMTRFHASVFLSRRHQTGGFPKQFLGASLPPGPPAPALLKTVPEAFQFVRVPAVWRDIQPKEQGSTYEALDQTLKSCAAAKLPIRLGPLLSFGVQSVPDWMYIWEHDFENIFDFAQENIRRTAQRYAGQVGQVVAISGVHADNVFSFNFEQVMELTRMAAGAVKQAAPRSQVLIDVTQPWGEYYARNQQTVPPMLYAEMCVQSGISFDAFGLQFIFGIPTDGYHLRDMLQISALIDRIANFGKPLHITAVAVPSVDLGKRDPAAGGGSWHAPWSEQAQADWLTTFFEVALSKPYVESVCIECLADDPQHAIPSGGVLHTNLAPKPAYKTIVELRKKLTEPAK